MKDKKNENNCSIVNVIDDFDYSTQSELYNEKFKRWRNKRENQFSFNFKENKKESIYIDGRGFIEKSAETAEKKVLANIFYSIGMAMLIYLVFDDFLSKLFVSLLSYIGVDVHNNYFSSTIYGGSTEIVTVLILGTLMKVLVPLLFLHFRFKLPKRVEFMSSMNNPLALIGAISTTIFICTAVNLPDAYFSETKEIYEFFKNLQTDVSVWGQSEFLVYTIFDTIIISIVSEMFFRGSMFAVLRQFGDPFAIIVTSIVTGLLTQDFSVMPVAIIISMIASYGMITSGTIFTSVSVVVVYKMYNLALTIIEVDPSDSMPFTRNRFMFIMLLTSLVGFLVYWIYVFKTKKTGLALYRSEMPHEIRFVHSVRTFPFSVVSVICLVYALVKAVV